MDSDSMLNEGIAQVLLFSYVDESEVYLEKS